MNFIIIGSIIGVVVIILVVLFVLLARSQYKYNFKIHSRDLKNTINTKARIVTKEEDKRVRKFQVKGNDQYLDLHDPTTYEDGKPVRDITIDEGGLYVYIEKSTLDDKAYKTSSVEPVERSLIISQLADNQKKNPVSDKTALIAQIAWIVLAVAALIGIIFVITKFSKMGDTLIDLSKEQKEVSANALKIEQLRLEYQSSVEVQDDGSLLRTLESNDEQATT